MLVRALEISGQAHGVGNQAHLVRQFLEQAHVGGSESLAGGAWSKLQLADGFPLVDKRESEWFRWLIAITGGNSKRILVLEQNGSIGQLECLGHGLHNRREDGI